MFYDTSESLLSSLDTIKKEPTLIKAHAILKEFWSGEILKYGYDYVQMNLPERLQENAFFILDKLQGSHELMAVLKLSILEVFTEIQITYSLIELEALLSFNRCEFNVASNYFQIIPNNYVDHHREALLSRVFKSNAHTINSTKNSDDIADYLDERLRMNIEFNTFNIDEEKIKVYYRNSEFNFGRHKGEIVGSLNVPLEYLLWCFLNVPFFTVDYSFLNYIVYKNPSLQNKLAIEVAMYKNELAQINEEALYEQGLEEANEADFRDQLYNEEIDLISGGSVDPEDFDGDWDRLYGESGLD